MTAHVSTFDHDPAWNESLKAPFLRSTLLHVAIIGGFSAYAYWIGGIEVFGDKNAGGSTVGIEVVQSIPLPSRGEANPVANDTKSVAPPPPAPKAAPKAKVEPPPPDAIAIEKSKTTPRPTPPRTLRSFEDIEKNQVTSKSAPALSNPMFAPVAGSGQIGVGANTTLGTRFPAYAAQLRQIVQQNWRTSDVDPSIKTAPRVTVVFELLRNGTVRNIQLRQKSGIATLDFSIQRAIQISSFPPLPQEYERQSIDVEFQFELRR